MLDEGRLTEEFAPQPGNGYMRERERSTVDEAMDAMDGISGGRWFIPSPTRSATRYADTEALIRARLAETLRAGGMSEDATAEHFAQLAELRDWLGGPLWQMTVEQADAYFGRQIAWHEYPALLRQAQALARYFAFLAGPDGAPVREHVHTPVRCPLDALNWPTPAHQIRDAEPQPSVPGPPTKATGVPQDSWPLGT